MFSADKANIGSAVNQPQFNINVSPNIAPVISSTPETASRSDFRGRRAMEPTFDVVQKTDEIARPNVGSLRPEIATLSHDEGSDVWNRGSGETAFPAVVLPFSNEARPPIRTASVQDIRARLTYYKVDRVEEFRRVDSGCWAGEAYRYANLAVGDIAYLIAGVKIDGRFCVVGNPRYSAARYAEDHTTVDHLPAGTYEIKVELVAGDHGEYAETFWFQLDVGDQLRATRINQRPASAG
jgi:hypothetical protein